MKIVIPLFAIQHRKIGGTEAAIYNLAIGLARLGARLELVHGGLERLSPEFIAWLGTAPGVTLRQGTAFSGPKSLRFLEETLFSLRGIDADWIIYPNYFISPFRRRGVKVATILHDVQYKTLPQYHSAKRKAWLNTYLPWMFRRSDKVFLVSQSEKDIVRKHFGDAAAEKCDVIYNGIDWARLETPTSAPDSVKGISLRQPYILSVSYSFPHKNLKCLISAFAQLHAKHPYLHLYLAGIAAQETLDYIDTALTRQARAHVRVLGFLSDADLGVTYRNATVFAAPSLYEGFGMPAVEAMGFGIPTLISNRTALPEVTLGLARHVEDAESPSAWCNALNEIITSGWQPSPEDVARIRLRFDITKVAQTMLEKLVHFA